SINVDAGIINLGSATAGDDIVLPADALLSTAVLTSTGLVTAAENADTTGAGDLLVAAKPMNAFNGHVYSTADDGSHIDIQVTTDRIALQSADAQGATGDVRLKSFTNFVQAN